MTALGNWTEAWKQMVEGMQNSMQSSAQGEGPKSVPHYLWHERYRKVLEVVSQAEPVLGQTPKEMVWRKNKSKLYRFTLPGVAVTKKTPILMVYAMINKPYILDVEPGNSFVEHLLLQGYDVFLLDWGEAGIEDRHNGFAEYILDYLTKAVERVCLLTGQERINLFSYCMGGTMATMYASLFPERVKNLVVLAAPIDFRHAVLYNKWLDEQHFDVDKMVETFGNVPSHMIDMGNKMLKPMSNFINPWVQLFDKVDNEKFVHNWRLLNKWVNDGTDFPGQMYREWIHDFYQQNKLIQGEIVLRGRRVDLANIECPVLIVTAEQDHIAPCNQTRALLSCIKSTDQEEHNYPVGHVSLVFGGTAKKRVYGETSAWFDARD